MPKTLYKTRSCNREGLPQSYAAFQFLAFFLARPKYVRVFALTERRGSHVEDSKRVARPLEMRKGTASNIFLIWLYDLY
jgi:hypothetical protein